MPRHILPAPVRRSLTDIADRYKELSDELWKVEQQAMTVLEGVDAKLKDKDNRALMTTAELDMQSCAQAAMEAADSLLALAALTH